jgi:hypothetical protein
MFGRTHGICKGTLLRLLVAAFFGVGLVILLVRVQPASAAPWQAAQASSGEVPRVSLTEINGTPGASLMIPFYFTPDPNKPLRSVTVDIDYVSNNLKFQKASKGVAADQAGAEITTNLTDGTPDDKGITRSTLRVTASLGQGSATQGLPDGLLAYLLFQISLDAKPFAIKLNTTVVSAEDLKNQKLAKMAAEPGLVVVEVLDVMPEATCFFFSH